MLRCSRRLLSLLAVAGLFAAVPATVSAAELGEARVSSHIGQPLVADIELALIDDPAQTVSVRVASAEVYNGAGIAMPPVLAGLNLSVMRRDGRQFLHLTSLRPVDSEHLHLYLELSDKGQRTVRLATLWLTPDPNPAPPAAPVPLPAPVTAPVSAPPPEPVPAPVRKPQVRKAEPAPATMVRAAPAPAAKPAPTPMSRPLPAPVPVSARQAAGPAVCEQQTEQARICAALDGKNAALKAQLGSLEGKVKSLQASLGAAPAASVAPAAPAPAPVQAPPGPKPISAIKPLVPRKPKPAAPEPKPEAGLPWGWIGGGTALLLALAGALLLLRRRVRTVRKVDMPAAPRLVDRLRGSFPARSRAAAPEAAEAAEPSFD